RVEARDDGCGPWSTRLDLRPDSCKPFHSGDVWGVAEAAEEYDVCVSSIRIDAPEIPDKAWEPLRPQRVGVCEPARSFQGGARPREVWPSSRPPSPRRWPRADRDR